MHLIALHDTVGLFLLGPKFIYINSLLKNNLAFILPNFKASPRIGPYNEDIISLLVGSLLGDDHVERLKKEVLDLDSNKKQYIKTICFYYIIFLIQ
jgi:hypothetical protein